jgi:hypothetical protein
MMPKRKNHYFCLSYSNEQRVLMLHEEEKRHAWSGWMGSSFFAPGICRLIREAGFR